MLKIRNFLKNKKVIFVVLILSFATFTGLWNVVSGGYDKQNKTILFLKKFIPSKISRKVRDVVFNLSADPSGSTLPNSHNPSFLKSLGGKGGLNKKIRDVYNLKNEHSTKTSVYQYRVPKTKWRVLWWVDFPNNILTIVDFIQRDKLDSKLSYKGVRGFKF